MFVLTQIVGIVITIHIFIVWILNRKLDSFTDSIFVFTTIETLISQLLDIACQFAISKTYFQLNDFWIDIIIKTYLISIPLYILSIAIYSNRLIFKNEKYKKALIILISIIFISTLIIYLLPVSYNFDPRCSIPTGASVIFTYVITLVWSLLLIIELIYFKKKIDKYAYYASLIWISIFLFGGLTQYILLNTLYVPVISLILGIGVFVLYVVIENPGNKFDYNSNCFHFESFIEYITEIIENRDIQSILYISISETNGANTAFVKNVFDELIMQFENDYDIKIFTGHTNELIITAKLFESIQFVADIVSECVFSVEREIHQATFKASIVLIPEIYEYIDSYNLLREIFNDHQANSRLPEKIHVVTLTNDICKKYNEELRIAKEIDTAIKNENVYVDYQIIKNRDLDSLINIESCVKLIASDKSEINYTDHYRIINKYGKYVQIDNIAFKKICRVLNKIVKNINNFGYVLIRLSVQALEEDDVVQKYKDIINKEKINPNKICFELTNADAISKKDVLIENINILNKLGFTFAIGGFGSGESNLNYFIDLPAQIIKFDRSVLNNALQNSNANMIMSVITDLAHSLNYKVIAVGIEDEKGKECVGNCGVDMMIGKYYYDIVSEENLINKGDKIC